MVGNRPGHQTTYTPHEFLCLHYSRVDWEATFPECLGEIHGCRNIKTVAPEAFFVAYNLPGWRFCDYFAVLHHDDCIGVYGLLGPLRDVDHGQVVVTVQSLYQIENFRSALWIQHGSGFVAYQVPRFHYQDSGDGESLLLATGEKMRGMVPVGRQMELVKRVLDTATNFRRRKSDVFEPEGKFPFNGRRNELVVRILKDHADAAMNLPGIPVRPRVYPIDCNRTGRRPQ